MITFNMSLKQYIFLNVSTHALHLNEPFGVNMEHLCALFKEINEKQNPEDPRGWKKIPEESEDPKIVSPGVSKVKISRGSGSSKNPLQSLMWTMIPMFLLFINHKKFYVIWHTGNVIVLGLCNKIRILVVFISAIKM